MRWLMLALLAGEPAVAMGQEPPLPMVNRPTVFAQPVIQAAPGTTMVNRPGQARTRRSRDGHFYVTARLNSTTASMMVDTGASGIFLSHDDATRAGLNPESLDFSVRTSTANGQGLAARARLSTLTVGGITRHDVPVLVSQPGAASFSLLGQTFLSQLSTFQVTGGEMVMVAD